MALLVVSQADFDREGVADYERIFGRKITARHFRSLLQRTIDRDGGREDWDRVELYLRAKPVRKQAAAESGENFPWLLQTINDGATDEQIWKTTFQVYRELLKNGQPAERSKRRLRDFLWQHKPALAPSREAIRKAFDRRLVRDGAGEAFDKRAENGGAEGWLAEQLKALPWFIRAARFFYLLTNRTEDAGSVPEAVRMVVSLPNLPVAWLEGMRKKFLQAIEQTELPIFPEDLREAILARQSAYQSLVPRSIARQITVNPTLVKFYRSPRNWALDNLSAPGSQRRYNNDLGERVAMTPGDWFGGDDATPGIAVCVPVSAADALTPTTQKFGVMIGRFQWLAYHDARTDKILAWDYVVRPRGSYRAEDILNGMDAVIRTHGVPRQGFQFEGGTYNSKLVRNAISALGLKHWRTYSPHQKSIERVFNDMWKRLAVQFPHADLGRYRGENESNCRIYEACKAGHKDPRRYFPTLDLLLRAIDEVVGQHNQKPIDSRQSGRWVPDEFFNSAVAKNPLRKFSPEMEWIFSPWAVERTVKGMLVSCRVPMFEGVSVPFEFGADWLPAYSGKKVRIHFNPRQPKCRAKVILLEDCGEMRAGVVLGDAEQIGDTAGKIRFILGWGDDSQRAGYVARQKTANAMRRETRGIGSGGRVEYSKSEQRDGIDQTGIVERGGPPAPTPDERQMRLQRLRDSLSPDNAAEDRQLRRAELHELESATAHIFDQ